MQARLPGRRRGPLNIAAANRHGQQLFLANMASSKNGYRRPTPRPQPSSAAAAKEPSSRDQIIGQLDLFTPDPILRAARSYGFGDPPDERLARRLDHAAREHAARHGWTKRQTQATRTGIRVLLARHQPCEPSIRASDVGALSALELPSGPVLAVLTEAGLLHDDRPATVATWFAQQTSDLPEQMAGELRTWFDVLHDGNSTPPRSRPRSPITIKTRLRWTMPTLHGWAAAGHQSLREISREDVLAVLPASGNPRAQLGHGLRSIFGTLKAHKVVFLNPMARIQIGNFERRTPLPADPVLLRAALNSRDPPGAALAALVVFHGLRPVELRDLRLTDVRDGRLHLAERTIPLADPVKVRLGAYLDYRFARWPNSINPYFFIHGGTAGTTRAVQRYFVNTHLGMPAQAIRADRIVDEAHATAGDLRRICDFFGVTMATAEHYASSLNHPALTDVDPAINVAGSRTHGQT